MLVPERKVDIDEVADGVKEALQRESRAESSYRGAYKLEDLKSRIEERLN